MPEITDEWIEALNQEFTRDHIPHHEQPGLINQYIREFIKRK